MLRFAAALVALLALILPARAATTINPAVPPTGAPLSSAAVRGNFGAAANDVNNLLSMFLGTSPPANPSVDQLWSNPATIPYTVTIWDGTQWDSYGLLNPTTHAWTPANAISPGGNGAYTGNNTASGYNALISSSTECPPGAGTLPPAHNGIACVQAGNLVLAPPSPFLVGGLVKLNLTENSTGGYTVAIPASGFSVNPNLFDGTLGAPYLAVTTTAGAVNEIDLDPEVVNGVNIVLVHGISAGMVPYTGTVPFTPTQVSGLISWGDPSNVNTLWASANCTGAHVTPTGGGATIASISDANSGGYCWNATGTVNAVVSGGIYYLVLNGSSYLTGCTSCGGFANAAAIGQNVPIVIGVMGAYFPSDTTSQSVFAVNVNGGPTLVRWGCGLDLNQGTGQGVDMRVRVTDAAGGAGVDLGNTTGQIATPIVEDCNMIFNSGGNSGAVSFNNGTPVTASGVTATQNTANTTNSGAFVGASGDVSGTRIYGWEVAQPTSPLSSTVQTQMQRYLGGKMGLSF